MVLFKGRIKLNNLRQVEAPASHLINAHMLLTGSKTLKKLVGDVWVQLCRHFFSFNN